MMNLPLLFWAAEQTHDPRCHQIARDHADISAEHLVRADASTAHTFFFDQHTGSPIGAQTHQGYANDSMWARGQAWAIFGFAVAAQWTHNPAYRDLAQRAAVRFMAELPEDRVPRWDLRLPPGAPQYPDTSASGIAAAGMLRLAAQADAQAGHALRAQAETLLEAAINAHLETRQEAQGLLRGGTYHAHKGMGVNKYFICGDYFFFEAVLMAQAGCPDFWGPPDSTT
jgi:unsaturated chondroitin disaccharide hydrolase